jgi:hypothetical protein
MPTATSCFWKIAYIVSKLEISSSTRRIIFLIVAVTIPLVTAAQSLGQSMPAVWMNYDGRLEVFYRGAGGACYHSWQQSAAVESNWANNASLGGVIIGQPVAVSNGDGRLEVFAVGTDSNIYHTWQISPGGGWSAWAGVGFGPVSQSPSVVETAGGILQAFAVAGGTLYTSQEQIPNNSSSWGPWTPLTGASIAAPPSTIRDYDGNLYIFSQGTNGAALYNVWSPSSSSWSGWSSLGGGIIGPPTAAINLDGTIEIVVIGTDHAVYHNWQTGSGSWSGWNYLGGWLSAAPSVVANKDGTLEIFAVGSDSQAWYNRQLSPSGGWSGWYGMGGGLSSTISAFRNVDGRVEIFTQVSNGQIFFNYQMSPSGGWSNWYPIGGTSNPTPSQSAATGVVQFGARGGTPSAAEQSAFWLFGKSKPTPAGGPTPTLPSPYPHWPCATVRVSFLNFGRKFLDERQQALDNWNKELKSTYPTQPRPPVYFTQGPGDGIHTLTVKLTPFSTAVYGSDPKDIVTVQGGLWAEQ